MPVVALVPRQQPLVCLCSVVLLQIQRQLMRLMKVHQLEIELQARLDAGLSKEQNLKLLLSLECIGSLQET